MRLHIRLHCAVLLGILALTAPGAAETAIERGDYLVNSVGSCGNCHTQDAASHVPGAALSGGFAFEEDFGQ